MAADSVGPLDRIARLGQLVEESGADLSGHVLAAQIGLLYKSPLAIVANLVISAILAVVLWTDYPKALLLTWLSAMGAIVLARLVLWHRYQTEAPAGADLRQWARLFVLGTAATGLLWGAAAAVIVMTGPFVHHAMVGFVIAGMTAGAVAATAVYLPAFHAFLATSLTPLIAAYFAHGEANDLAMGTLAAVYGVMIIMVARNLGGSMKGTFLLEIRNGDLIREIAGARDAAQAASEAKSQFLAHVSHELRTPLNAILGFSETLRSGIHGPLGDPRYADYLGHVHESGQHLLALINDLLDLSRADAGALTLKLDRVDLGDVARSCVDTIAVQAAENDVTLDVESAADLPSLRADPLRLRQILLNLLGNAVKFTPRGGRVSLRISALGKDTVAISVSDTGIGMDPNDVPKALAPFIQIDDGSTRSYEGAGLGLPITHRLVLLHGGTLSVSTAKGKGMTVQVTLPMTRSAKGTVVGEYREPLAPTG